MNKKGNSAPGQGPRAQEKNVFCSKRMLRLRKQSKNGVVIANSRGILAEIARGEV